MDNYTLDSFTNTVPDNAPTDSSTPAIPVLDAIYSPSITTSELIMREHQEPIQPDDTIYTPQVIKVRKYQLYKSRNGN